VSNGNVIVLATVLLSASMLLRSMGRASAANRVDYTTQIEPIFRSSCYSCHQGDRGAAKFRLDSRPAPSRAARRGRRSFQVTAKVA